MDVKDKIQKLDPNTEAFQMRNQWKKTEVCRLQWHANWFWLLEERKLTLQKCHEAREIALDKIGKAKSSEISSTESVYPVKSLQPVPLTAKGVVGWLSGRPECQLEVYTSWRMKPPMRAPDAWEKQDYLEHYSK